MFLDTRLAIVVNPDTLGRHFKRLDDPGNCLEGVSVGLPVILRQGSCSTAALRRTYVERQTPVDGTGQPGGLQADLEVRPRLSPRDTPLDPFETDGGTP